MCDTPPSASPQLQAGTAPPLLSVVIRCRNEARLLEQVLRALALQECAFGWEVIVVDNASTDATQSVAREFGARILEIERDGYTHGRALNLGAAAAGGSLLLNLSAHSLPVGRHFLEDAAAPFQDSEIAAAMCMESGRGLVAGWLDPIDIHWPSGHEPKTRHKKLLSVLKMTNSALVIRRAVWEQTPFDERLESTEDKDWGMKVLAQGYKIRRCSEAVYVSLVTWDRRTIIARRTRAALARYRITGEPPLTFRGYLGSVVKGIARIAGDAVMDVRDELALNTALLRVPRQAGKDPIVGSRPENEEHR